MFYLFDMIKLMSKKCIFFFLSFSLNKIFNVLCLCLDCYGFVRLNLCHEKAIGVDDVSLIWNLEQFYRLKYALWYLYYFHALWHLYYFHSFQNTGKYRNASMIHPMPLFWSGFYCILKFQPLYQPLCQWKKSRPCSRGI